MQKKYFGIIITTIVVLLVCNITTLVLLVSKPPQPPVNEMYHHPEKGHKKSCFLKEKLQLTPQQAATFDSIKNIYRNRAKEMDRQLKNTQREYIMLLSNDDKDTAALNLARKTVLNTQDSLFGIIMQQYQDYRNVLDTSRQEQLKEVYLEMFKCKDCKHNNAECKH
ncbi:MAG: periplasmic heavy metal sensor [Bacteroidales bacterium]|nr:periplasmic heavy metal sensor [Bacteroidales bacterium]